MSHHDIRSAARPDPDQPMVDIADYVADYTIDSKEAYDTARYMLLDSLGCAMLAMKFPDCVKHLGPVVPGAMLPGGARVPGTSLELDPVQARVQHRHADPLARFQRHLAGGRVGPSVGQPRRDPGASADYLSRKAAREGGEPLTVRDVLTLRDQGARDPGLLCAEELVQPRRLDHVILVRLASTAVATAMLGGGKDEIINAVSHSWIDNGALRTYRHAPNTGPRKSWAAGDACRRAVTHALNAVEAASSAIRRR